MIIDKTGTLEERSEMLHLYSSKDVEKMFGFVSNYNNELINKSKSKFIVAYR